MSETFLNIFWKMNALVVSITLPEPYPIPTWCEAHHEKTWQQHMLPDTEVDTMAEALISHNSLTQLDEIPPQEKLMLEDKMFWRLCRHSS